MLRLMFYSVLLGCGFGPEGSNLRAGEGGRGGRNPLGHRNVKVVPEFFNRAG